MATQEICSEGRRREERERDESSQGERADVLTPWIGARVCRVGERERERDSVSVWMSLLCPSAQDAPPHSSVSVCLSHLLLHPLLSSLRGSSDADWCVCVAMSCVCVSLSLWRCVRCAPPSSPAGSACRVCGRVAPSCLDSLLFHRRLSGCSRDEEADTNGKKDG